MKILERLLGWTGYDPLTFFQHGMLFTLAFLFGLLLYTSVLRYFGQARTRPFILWNMAGLALSYAIFLLYPFLLGDLISSMRANLLLFAVLYLPLRIFLLRSYWLPNLFISVYIMCFNFVVIGIGNLLYIHLASQLPVFAGAATPILIRLALYALALPFGTRSLGRLFAAWSGRGALPFWSVVWLIPAALFVVSWRSGNVLTLSAPHFLATRLLPAVALYLCSSLMTGLMEREQEMAKAGARAELLDRTGQSIDRTREELLRAWDQTNAARKKARALVEGVLAHTRDGDGEQVSRLIESYAGALRGGVVRRVCGNAVVNALAAHYAAVAGEEGIEITFRLDIPARVGTITNLDMSRIVGNMLDNAVEACERMEYGHRFIRLSSMTGDGLLILTMDNSFDGEFRERPNGQYVSRKRRSGAATGLSSIRAVAEKYGGGASFEADGRVFQTSVHLKLDGGMLSAIEKPEGSV